MPWGKSTVPTHVRTACLKRDGHQCTAIQQNGTRCPETTNLQAAHWTQWQPNETTTVHMVRTLCAWHHMTLETKWQAASARKRNKRSPYREPEQHPAYRNT